MRSNYFKILETANSYKHIAFPIPPTIIKGYGLNNLTFIRFNGAVLELKQVTWANVKPIIQEWTHTNWHPICYVKSDSADCLFYSAKEVIEHAYKLHNQGVPFIVQKFIVSSQTGCKLIRSKYSKKRRAVKSLGLHLSLPTIYLNSIKMNCNGIRNDSQFRVSDAKLRIEKDCNHSFTKIKTSRKLEKYTKKILALFQEHGFSKDFSYIECDFIKDINGNLYFLKLNDYRTDDDQLKSPNSQGNSNNKELTLSVKPSRSNSVVSTKNTRSSSAVSCFLAKKHVIKTLNYSKNEIVSDILEHAGIPSIKHFTYSRWANRTQNCYLDKVFANTIKNTQINSPRQTIKNVKVMKSELYKYLRSSYSTLNAVQRIKEGSLLNASYNKEERFNKSVSFTVPPAQKEFK